MYLVQVSRMSCLQPLVGPHAPTHVTRRAALRLRETPTRTFARRQDMRSSRMAILAMCSLLMWRISASPCSPSSSDLWDSGASGHCLLAAAHASRWRAPILNFASSRATTPANEDTRRRRKRKTNDSRTAGDTCSTRGSLLVGGTSAGGSGKSIGTESAGTATASARKFGRRHEQDQHSSKPQRLELPAWIQLGGKYKSVGEESGRDSTDNQNPERGNNVLVQLQKRGGRIWRSEPPAAQADEQQQRQQLITSERISGNISTRTAAMVRTLARGPSALKSGASAAVSSAAACIKATPGKPDVTSATEAAVPPKSYLLWSAAPEFDDKEQNDSTNMKATQISPRQTKQATREEANKTSNGGNSRGEEGARKREGSLGTAKESRGGAAAAAAGQASLTFSQAMFAGAVSRSIAQTCMQPANVVKTLLQGRGTSQQLSNLSFNLLTRGAGAQFVMSLPHGAFNYATLEVILGCTNKVFPKEWREKAGPALDFFSSSVATLVCSIVSTPQMVLTDRIMAGMYPNLFSGVREITRTQGLKGFYTGWSANVAQKIPSYGLTWVFFQQFKRLHRRATDRAPTNTENFVLGAAAAGATVCIMIPMDTVKTRLVTQTAQAGVVPYRGVLRTLVRVVKEEGVGSIYRALTPRLVSVVPMIGIQFGIYEFIRKEIIARRERDLPKPRLPVGVRRTLGLDKPAKSLQQEYLKDFLHNVMLMEEELV